MNKPRYLGAFSNNAALTGARLLELDDEIADSAISAISGELPYGEHSRALAIEALSAAAAAPYSRAARQGARDIKRAGAPSWKRAEEAWGKCFPKMPAEIATRDGEILTPADIDLELPPPIPPALARGIRNAKGEIVRPPLPVIVHELNYAELAQLIQQLGDIATQLKAHITGLSEAPAPAAPAPAPALAAKS